MGLISKTFTIGCACAGLAAASQMPEFAQQYRQRLAGAVEELRVVVANFDQDAKNSGITREQALTSLTSSEDKFPQDRGKSMTRTIERFTALNEQQAAMEKAEPVSRPLFMMSSPDEALLKGTWEIFEPAIPLNAPGAMWGGFGALLLGLLARFPIGLTRRIKGRRNKINVDHSAPVLIDPEEGGAPTTAQPVLTSVAVASHPAIGHGELPQNVTLAIPPSGSLLDQIVLDQKVVGEIDPHGRIIIDKPPVK